MPLPCKPFNDRLVQSHPDDGSLVPRPELSDVFRILLCLPSLVELLALTHWFRDVGAVWLPDQLGLVLRRLRVQKCIRLQNSLQLLCLQLPVDQVVVGQRLRILVNLL